jgi:hypothetical protein
VALAKGTKGEAEVLSRSSCGLGLGLLYKDQDDLHEPHYLAHLSHLVTIQYNISTTMSQYNNDATL